LSTANPTRTPVIAASIDVGSNSVHLLAAVVAGHRLVPLVDESELLGLGSTVDLEGRLGPVRRAELLAVLQHYVETARRLGAVAVTIVGTEPMRRAADVDRIVEDLQRTSSATLQVLTHEEEAFLTLIGVTAGRRVPAELGVVDVGGGSSEVALVAPDRPAYAAGLSVGSARLTARLVEHDPPTREEIAALRAAAREAMTEAPPGAPRVLIAVGGTATNLLRVLPEAALEGILTRGRLAEALAILAAEPAAEAAVRHAVRPVRARILPAGAAILEALLERYGLDQLRVSDAGIREGAIFVQRHAPTKWRERLPVLAEGWSR
jgi:exopolyphosphatase/pppGpp-phosphohydrolase